MTSFLTGLVLGVAGSGHCAGMCGPLVLTIGQALGRPSRASPLRHSVLYHAGRIGTYIVLAVPAGVAGQAISARGFGRVLAILAGLLLLLAAASAVRLRIPGLPGRMSAAVLGRACAAAQRWGRTHPIAGPVGTGAANGLLPCGLVYAALAVAVATGSTTGAIVLMAGFGLGTAPVLIALSLSAASVPLGLRMRLRRLTPAVLALAAALLFARALAGPHPARHGHEVPAEVVRDAPRTADHD